jgi:hypothetical protein
MNPSLRSWKTTLAGVVTAGGVYLQTVHDPAWLNTCGQVMTGLGGFLTGLFARDSNKSSEQVGAGPAP